jgi:hypothetical protein
MALPASTTHTNAWIPFATKVITRFDEIYGILLKPI